LLLLDPDLTILVVLIVEAKLSLHGLHGAIHDLALLA
jgi:hypothetical protein